MAKRKGRVGSEAGAETAPSGAQCKTLSVPEAGALYFGLGRNGSYKAAKIGLIPTIDVLGKKRVPIVLMDRRLEEPGAKSSETKGA